MLQLELTNDIRELSRLNAALDRFAAANGLDEALRFRLNLVLEELFVNVVRHGFEDAAPHTIGIRVEREGEAVAADVRDSGRPFDPTARVADPVQGATLANRPAGGQGLPLVRQMADEIAYQRSGNENVVRLRWRARPDSDVSRTGR